MPNMLLLTSRVSASTPALLSFAECIDIGVPTCVLLDSSGNGTDPALGNTIYLLYTQETACLQMTV